MNITRYEMNQLEDLFVQRHYLYELMFKYIDEKTINKAIKKIDYEIKKRLESIQNEEGQL